jgi:hypothetical protein
MFAAIGYLSRKPLKGAGRFGMIAAGVAAPVIILLYGLYAFSGSTLTMLAGVATVAVVLVAVPYLARSSWTEVQAASSIGQAAGSLIVGFGIVAYSTFFVMPQVLGLGSGVLPIAFAYGTTLWTYLSEIPFLLVLTPPIVKAVRATLPSLRIEQTTASKTRNA